VSAGSGWRPIAARDIEVGDIVSVLGTGNRRSTIIHVRAVDSSHAEQGELVIEGRQPWAGSFRYVMRHVHPEARAELLIESDDPYEGER